MSAAHIEEAIEDIRQGKMIILVDDEDRENEGDLTMAAELVTPEAINFMARFGRGLVCLALDRRWWSACNCPRWCGTTSRASRRPSPSPSRPAGG